MFTALLYILYEIAASVLRQQQRKRDWLEQEINLANKEYLGDEPFQDIPDLSAKLEKLKCVFMKHDSSNTGEIDYATLHVMALSLGICWSIMELKKRVNDVTGNSSNSLTYKDCAMAMLGRRSTMCQRIMRFSGRPDIPKQSCLLDVNTTYISTLEFTIPSNLPSPRIFFPPPPPPSPVDAPTGGETYPAA